MTDPTQKMDVAEIKARLEAVQKDKALWTGFLDQWKCWTHTAPHPLFSRAFVEQTLQQIEAEERSLQMLAQSGGTLRRSDHQPGASKDSHP